MSNEQYNLKLETNSKKYVTLNLPDYQKFSGSI